MAKKKGGQIADPIHGAEGHEMTDADLAELEAETQGAEVEETELPPEELQEELPEETPQPEVEEEAEPDGESDVERLKRLGMFRPGLIETVDDLVKSYHYLEKAFSDRPKVEVPQQPAPDPQKMMEELQYEYEANPIAAVAKIASAMQYGTQQELAGLRNELFYSSNPDARNHQEGIDSVMKRYPGIGIRDAYNMYRGENFDKLAEAKTTQVAQQERRRALEKTIATREKGGGVRTSELTPERGLLMATQGKSGNDKVEAMIDYLEKHGLGLKE